MIYFIGGGVGTAEYLTMMAVRVLRRADVVLYSKYLDKSVVTSYIKKSCRKICFSDMKRQEVDSLLLQHHEHVVVYLANGDFACYGTVQDHFDFCKSKNLQFRVIPGVSSLGAAAAVLANEFVLPNISNSLVVTYMEDEGNLLSTQTIREWAKHNATMAIHMVERRLYPLLKQRLLDGGLHEDVPVVIVSEALRETQHVLYTTVGQMDSVLAFPWMSLVLVGNVFQNAQQRNELSKLPFVNEFRRAEHYNRMFMELVPKQESVKKND